jgi:hypothetical protein
VRNEQGEIFRGTQGERATGGAATTSRKTMNLTIKTRSFAQGRAFTISPAAHTPPLRLSTVWGEKMRGFADSEKPKGGRANPKFKIQNSPTIRAAKSDNQRVKSNRQSQIAKSPDGPMNR